MYEPSAMRLRFMDLRFWEMDFASFWAMLPYMVMSISSVIFSVSMFCSSK